MGTANMKLFVVALFLFGILAPSATAESGHLCHICVDFFNEAIQELWTSSSTEVSSVPVENFAAKLPDGNLLSVTLLAMLSVSTLSFTSSTLLTLTQSPTARIANFAHGTQKLTPPSLTLLFPHPLDLLEPPSKFLSTSSSTMRSLLVNSLSI